MTAFLQAVAIASAVAGAAVLLWYFLGPPR